MKSGIEHIVSAVPVLRSQFESEQFHNLTHGNAFPTSPVERQLFYRDDEHIWYIYNGTAWTSLQAAAIDKLDDIGDVDVAAPADLESLYWDAGTSTWKAKPHPDASKVIWKDVSQRAIADLDRTVTLDWTDLDLTAHTSAKAKHVILNLFGLTNAYTSGYMGLAVRKNGTTPLYVNVVRHSPNVGTEYLVTENCIQGMDAGQVIEYKIEISGVAQIDSYIDVLGYIE